MHTHIYIQLSVLIDFILKVVNIMCFLVHHTTDLNTPLGEFYYQTIEDNNMYTCMYMFVSEAQCGYM